MQSASFVYMYTSSQAATSFGMVFSKPLRLARSRCRLAKIRGCLLLSSKPQVTPDLERLSWFCWQSLRSSFNVSRAAFSRASTHQLSDT